MVRETRHLWVGNLPDNTREDRIREHFKRYGRVQSVKLLPRGSKEETGESTMACTVAFMDIKSASKAHNAEHKLDDRTLTTEYYEPAAIPSAASPQSTPSAYSTSPGTAINSRFPNGHGSTSEEHGAFGERFYGERPINARVVNEGEFIRRGAAAANYHEANNCRGRNNGRGERSGYRNGPYSAIMDRSHRTVNNSSWSQSSYETAAGVATATATANNNGRYNSNSQNETGYVSATPSDNDRRPSSEQLQQQCTKKKTQSAAGSRSPSPSASASTRSPSRSRSRSSSSSSGSSTSRDTSSSGDRRPLAICVKNLPLRSSDTSLKDGLFHEYKKHGKVTWVKVVGQSSERYAIVCFKKPEDVVKALEVSYDKLFFGCKIEVEPYQGYDVEDNDLRPYEAEIDEFHPKATRTLFIGNLEKDVTASDLRKHFDQFGEIIEIDIKKQGAVGSYAFCQYSDIVSVVKAIRTMDGEHLGNNRIKLGFGKSMPTNCVWVDGVAEQVNEKYLRMQFEQFGAIGKVHVDREKGQALVFYDQVVGAQLAVNKMRGFAVKGNKIQVDFASRECQESFFEHLEKQGTVLDRPPPFEERRDPSASRFSRYETPTRPRTSSYSSRSSATATGQAPSALPSPGTPGSVTPRGGTGSRSNRVARFAEYYDQTVAGGAGAEYADRHFRNYDEYSQGSAASHEDAVYNEPADYPYNHEATGAATVVAVDPLDGSRAVIPQTVANDPRLKDPSQPPHLMKNLQKERVHLLEQLEECPSSGDEHISPKKRLKLDLSSAETSGVVTSDVIIEANRDHRKVTEVRRLSDPSLKHHRRPSVDGKHLHERTPYLPHAVCKRRKTAGSDSGSRGHHYEHSGSESVGGSRPGTPLVDERPEHFPPTEPRRIPREREGPLTLPLPRFAAQFMTSRGGVSVAGIKGQKDQNVLSSPPPAVTSPRISNPKPPSPVHHVPPPASPPPRPPSLSSNSSDSGDVTPPSPSLDERIRSLDEKYEKWSGSRALSAAGGEALAKLDATREKFRLRHKLLDLDLKEVQPSEIVKSVMAKKSVFDEDLKRLENVGEKYEPKEFATFPRAVTAGVVAVASASSQSSSSSSASSASSSSSSSVHNVVPMPPTTPPVAKAPPPTPPPKTPTMLSPRSAGSNVPAAKGLQYPFPSHPPLLNQGAASSSTVLPPPTPGTPTTPTSSSSSSPASSSSSGATTVTTATATTTAATTVAPAAVAPATSRGNLQHGDNVRLKPCASSAVPAQTSDTRTCSKVTNVNRSANINNSNSGVAAPPSTPPAVQPQQQQQQLQNVVPTKCEKQSVANIPIVSSDVVCCSSVAITTNTISATNTISITNDKSLINNNNNKPVIIKTNSSCSSSSTSSSISSDNNNKPCRRDSTGSGDVSSRSRRNSETVRKPDDCGEEEKKKNEQQVQQRLEKDKEAESETGEKQRSEKREKREDKERKEDNKDEDSRERKREEERRHDHEKHKHRENHEKHNHLHDNKKDEAGNNRSHDKSKHHSNSKDNVKENRDNNVHDKRTTNQGVGDVKVESRHMSIDFDKATTKSYDLSKSSSDPSKRKERNNSLPVSIGNKRRFSSHDSSDHHQTQSEDGKKLKLDHNRKLAERRDSKDSTRSDEKSKKHKNNVKYDDKQRHNNKDRDDKHKLKKVEKHKVKSKSREKDATTLMVTPKSPAKELSDKDFLARLDLRANEEIEKQKRSNKDCASSKSEKKKDDPGKDGKHQSSSERSKQREEIIRNNNDKSKRCVVKKEQRIRKLTQNSSGENNSDSDEPKKHSIFDIDDDEPAYISMYDKVKARSCKNMQKQEEEKRQEQIKAKFSQLKQSRAKREEKKRSTSWDEDSDSDRQDHNSKSKRNKFLSSDEDDSRIVKKREILSTDSDPERHHHHHNMMRQVKSESSEDDRIKSKMQRKGSKARITSDTSDDEDDNKMNPIKSEMFSDNEVDQGFADSESYTKIKDEFANRSVIKKERKHHHHHQDVLVEQMKAQIFGDSPLLSEQDRFMNNRHSFGDNSSADDDSNKKEMRKKHHKKKQKKKQHSLSGEDSNAVVMGTKIDSIEHHDMKKNKQHGKKDKKRDRTKEDTVNKSKSKKKSKGDSKSDQKRDGKMGIIFGSLSEDSESGTTAKENEAERIVNKPFLERFESNVVDNNHSGYAGDSDEKIKYELKDEHKKRKEKKRREKERRLLLHHDAPANNINENSMDFADMGKQLEANIKDDGVIEERQIKNEDTTPEPTTNDDPNPAFGFNYPDELFHHHESTPGGKNNKEERNKEPREKKKKRKKSKEEKQKHHHHHHHDKTTKKLEVVRKDEEDSTPKTPNQSLPNLIDAIPSPPAVPGVPTECPKTPTSSAVTNTVATVVTTTTKDNNKKREKFIPGFGSEIDEKLHENAIKSISEEVLVKKPPQENEAEVSTGEKAADSTEQPGEEKPRVVISQEETEDAVAALLGESFGGGHQFVDCYDEEEDISTTNDDPTAGLLAEDGAPQDDEEMRQAVQSLGGTDPPSQATSAATVTSAVDVKPETPQSEHELQIDTDTEEPEENRFEPPKTPEITREATRSPKTPEVAPTSSYVKTNLPKIPANIGSPPSLTPIKPHQEKLPAKDLSLPLLPEQNRPGQSWLDTPPPPPPLPLPPLQIPLIPTPPTTQAIVKDKEGVKPEKGHIQVRPYEAMYPPLTALSSSREVPSTVHNLPARSPTSYPSEIKMATSGPNRLPITQVALPKASQPTAVVLPQPKILEPPILVPTSDPKPRLPIYSSYVPQTARVPPPPPPLPRMPQGLLVPTRPLPPTTYGYYNMAPSTSAIMATSPGQPITKSSIIMSTHQVPTTSPFMAVIKEAPKMAPVTVEAVTSLPLPVLPADCDSKVVVKEVTSKPSPVIVQAPKEVATVVVTPPAQIPTLPISPIAVKTTAAVPECVKDECKSKVEEAPKSPIRVSAIERVTDELNQTLKKENDDDSVAVVVDRAESVDVKMEDAVGNVDRDADEGNKTETESLVSDLSKERSSADILTPNDNLDTREDSDYWSAKEVNIDSVIKTLCSADELSDHSSEIGAKDEWHEDKKPKTSEIVITNHKEDKKEVEDKSEELEENEHHDLYESGDNEEALPGKEVAAKGRRGGRGRGRKSRGDRGGLQRKAKIVKEAPPAVIATPPAKRGGRGGGRPKSERKISKSESEMVTSTDVYEFRDDSDESTANKERPRLILTIKPPTKEDAIEEPPQIQPVAPPGAEIKEEFASPVVANTRKSRRLQEKDVLRNTVDDTIEDVVKNTVVTRSATNARRSGRQLGPKFAPETPRKSPRGGAGSKKTRRASDPSEDSTGEVVKAKIESDSKSESDLSEICANKPNVLAEETPLPAAASVVAMAPKIEAKERPHEGLKAAMLRRVKGEMAQEPMTLIDPVTGLLTPMRECEEGRYVPLPYQLKSLMGNNEHQRSVIATAPQQPKINKPQSLKAHVLSSQAAIAQQHHQQQQQQQQQQQLQQQQQQQIKKQNVIVAQPVVTALVSKANQLGLSQNLTVNVSQSQRPINVLSRMSPVKTLMAQQQQQQQQQQQIMAQVSKQQLQQPQNMSKCLVSPQQIVNTQIAHSKHLQQQQQQHSPTITKQAVMGKGPIVKPVHSLQQHQQIMTGAIASPPPVPKGQFSLAPNRMVHPKSVMEAPNIDVSNVIAGTRSNLSPQGPRHHQPGLPGPAYEASLHGERSLYNRSRSPPPAHQNSPSPQGETIAHFPPVTLRPPHELHYMQHPPVYQFLRQQPYHLSRSPMVPGGLDKPGDGQEGEEAPVTSQSPSQLRRPGSVGLALTGRTPVVPHSLHSPHDRTTDSPQVGQVFGMHGARMQQHFQPTGRYYEQTAEPPPAHRPLTSHGSLAALGSDRGISSHMASLGTLGAPERPVSGHLQPDRPLSSHSALTAHMGGLGVAPERPLSGHLPSHGLVMGGGLGAAGNLMGAVARHVGVDAPTSQRGLQAATPPHASQVPPQAESLLMLLKQYPCMWQGLLALKNDQAAVQMYFVSGNDNVAKCSLPKNTDGSTPPLRIFQRMRLEPPQVEGVARKMQMENEHCMLLALPCGHDHMDVLKQSTNLTSGFITYLQQKQAAGIVNVAAPGTTQPPAYVVHIFPSCDFVNENLRRIAPSLLERVADIAHLLIVITTV